MLQMWLRDNPTIKRKYQMIAEQDSTKAEGTINDEIKLKETKISLKQKEKCDIQPLYPKKLAESIEKYDKNFLPPSVRGSNSVLDNSIVITIAEWG